ncbi:hypothetical protein BX600DRAFT_470252 [Xylariales sp. PMI_506]|nr:hypothetical protein BX600DRAFT_470252 [Xylariales sp. PMI_506]
MTNPAVMASLRDIISRQEELGPVLEPRYKKLGLRSSCPKPNCGLSDKHGLTNEYAESSITFVCPTHGSYAISLLKDDDMQKLEMNTPLRSLVRTLVFDADVETSWIQVKGRDYAGFYTEQLMWRPLNGKCAPIIFYSPLILDWSGAKISKSLFVADDAYRYLREQGLTYLLSYFDYTKSGHDVRDIYRTVHNWASDPKRLFRDYSIYQIHSELQGLSTLPLPILSDEEVRKNKM